MLDGASLSWPGSTSSVLTGVNLEVKRGQLVAVAGEVGAGKSTLLNAVVGGKVLVEASRFQRNGTLDVGYAGQSPFLMSASVQQNILVGRALDPVWYEHCVQASQLKPDLELLSHGDQTLVGERGTSLSGGQQARCVCVWVGLKCRLTRVLYRLSIARVLYGRPQLLVLDGAEPCIAPPRPCELILLVGRSAGSRGP